MEDALNERRVPLLDFDSQQLNAVRDIGQRALAISRTDYCSGEPLFHSGELTGFSSEGGVVRKLPYNNWWHNTRVGKYSGLVIHHHGGSRSDMELGEATGKTHDLRQLGGRGNDERASAEWIAQQIQESAVGLPQQAALVSAKGIIGTEPLFNAKGQIIGQKASQLEYASKWEEIFVKSIACADWGDVLTPIGPLLSFMVLLQRQGKSIEQDGDVSELLSFMEVHWPFIKNFQYLLPKAEFLATHRLQVTRFTAFIYQQALNSRIETWAQLIRLGVAFVRDPDMILPSRKY